MADPDPPPHAPPTRWGWRHLVGALLLAGVVALLLLFHVAAVLILIFGGLLFAAVLQILVDGLLWLYGQAGRRAGFLPRLPRKVAVVIVTILLVIVVGVGGWLASGPISNQVGRLMDDLPAAFASIKAQLSRYTFGRYLITEVGELMHVGTGGTFTRVTGVVSTGMDTLIDIVTVLFIGLYVAFEPRVYRSGLLCLFPTPRQERMGEVLDALALSMRRWLFGQLIIMAVLGTLMAVGLWIIGVPLAMLFGLLAALLTFIPTFGALVAFIPPALLAASIGPGTLLAVLILWGCAHLLEGYILVPLVQRRAVLLPPALGVSAQLILGVLIGPIGLIFALPLAMTVTVIVKMLYVEDDLNHPAKLPGDAAASGNRSANLHDGGTNEAAVAPSTSASWSSYAR